MEAAASPLIGWANFYVIVGSAAGALTGLQFVVIALAAQFDALGDASTSRAFATPTVVHFSSVLLVAALLTAPWHTAPSAGLAVGACGLAGLGYSVRTIRHARRQTDYAPVLEDWLFHAALPLAAYATLFVTGFAMRLGAVLCLAMIGAATLMLLFIGIHNAWDSVLYLAIFRRRTRST